MKSFHTGRGKSVALFAAVAVLTPAVMPLTAHAEDSKKEKALKTGAAVLGAVGAYYVVKGKTLKGALAGAAGYYAYKKSKDTKNDRTSGDVYPDNVRTRSTSTRSTSTRNSDPGYYSNDAAGDDVIYDEQDTYPAGRSASTRDERGVQRREERANRGERYPDDLGYVSLSDSETKTQADASTQETVLK